MFDQLSEKLRHAARQLTGRGRLTESNISDALREVRVALLEADVSLDVVQSFIRSVKERAVGREVLGSLQPGQAVIRVVQEELVDTMGGGNEALELSTRPPAVILVAGLQGAGKTTTVGKLGNLLHARQKKSVMLTSVDVYRPAAMQQLAVLAEGLELEFFASASRRPPDIALAALEQARRKAIDVLIVDTAGRFHVDRDMMEEVQLIHRAVKPVETLFVVDSMTGQDAVNSARAFDEALPLTGVVLTKTDGDARGGAALSIRQVTGKPIKFLGTGEDMDALEPFHPERVASRILGMGDVLSLVEEAERKVDHAQAERLTRKLFQGRGFDLEDFREQLVQMEKMGGIASMVDMLPGGGNMQNRALASAQGKRTPLYIAIINSMTPRERRFPAGIRGGQKKRIAAGSGTRVQDVNQLLKQFQQMQKMMKRMNRKGGMQNMMRKLGNPGSGGGRPGMPF